jgi:hypothetical protein
MLRFGIFFTIFLSACLAVAPVTAAAGYELQVAPGASDEVTSAENAVATLEAARDRIRAKRADGSLPEGDIVVRIAPGTYVLGEPFTLTAEDSGTVGQRIVYTASEPGATRLLGGRFVTGFSKVSDEAQLNKLSENARGQVYAADLDALGITDYGTVKHDGLELFFDGDPMQVARWPNEGFVKIVETTGGEEVDVRGTKGDRIGQWIYDGDRPVRWLDENDAWVYGYWFWDWAADHHKIKSIDPEQRQIEVEEPYHGYGYRKGQWYYALNLLSEIDMPGEWYLDREDGVLYFWPPAPLDDAEVFVSLLPHAVVMDGASHVMLEGLVIEGVRRTAIRVAEGESNRIANCTIRNTGGTAITISGGRDHGVTDCEIHDVGSAGITLNGGDRATLTASEHFAVNNYIHDYARISRMYSPGISISGVGQRAAHNEIANAPHMAIGFGGNSHLIEFNEIYNVCYESNDAGAIYAGRDWTMRGTVIRHNFMHNITGFEDRGCVGVYLDDMFCGTEIYGNLFYKVYRAAFIGGGRDNVYANNLFVDCPKALHIDARAMNWAADHVETTMMERLSAMPYAESPWKERFPELLAILGDEPAAPKGNRIEHNIFIGSDWNDVFTDAQPYVTLGENFTEGDPHFKTPGRFRETERPRPEDFELHVDSPAYATGFQPLLLREMGRQAKN